MKNILNFLPPIFVIFLTASYGLLILDVDNRLDNIEDIEIVEAYDDTALLERISELEVTIDELKAEKPLEHEHKDYLTKSEFRIVMAAYDEILDPWHDSINRADDIYEYFESGEFDDDLFAYLEYYHDYDFEFIEEVYVYFYEGDFEQDIVDLMDAYHTVNDIEYPYWGTE